MLKLRLSMGGTKKRPVYKIVVADSKFPRDGRFIEKLGFFNPLLPKEKKERIGLQTDRIKYWLSQGAQPTTRVARLLGEHELIPMPAKGNNPMKAVPKKERKKEAKEESPKEGQKADAPKAEEKKADAPKEAPKARGEKIKMFIAQVFTLYPEYFPGPFKNGLYGKAIEKKIWDLRTVNIRDYAIDKHKTVDDTPYGGGSGMLIKPDVLAKSLDKNINRDEKIVYLSPKGKVFNQKIAKELSLENKVNIICGHFEGIDQRVLENRKIDEISLGDFVLSGGETATYVFLDAILRLIPGVLGNEKSTSEESFENGLLEYPQYTKPQIWEEKSVPNVLLSGDHAKIKDWRLSQSEAITRDRRPDLWQKYNKKN